MPSRNKPKRLDRNRSWRVARRKKKRDELVNPKKRTRVRTKPKQKKVSQE